MSEMQRQARIAIDGQLGLRMIVMGEYFEWINIDKKERLEMGAFGSGFKVMEPCWVGN